MLQEVRTKLEAVNDEVCALRPMLSEPMEPSGPTLEPPSLPPPSTAPPPVDLQGMLPGTEDQTMETGGESDDGLFAGLLEFRIVVSRSVGLYQAKGKPNICS